MLTRAAQMLRLASITVASTPVGFWHALPAALAGRRRLKGVPCRPIFFLSTGRVGTKTLAALLARSRDALAVHEPEPSLFELSSLAYTVDHKGDRGVANVLEAAVSACRSPVVELARDAGRRYVETSPQGTFLAPAIAARWPGARFVAVMRHPADVVRSGMRRGWYAGHSHDPVRLQPGAEVAPEAFAAWSPFEKNCWSWAATNRWILDFAEASPPGRVEVFRSEELLRDVQTAFSLFAQLGLEAPADRTIKKALGQRRNAQEMGAFPVWSEWSAQDRRTLTNLAGDVAKELGYEI